MQIFSVARAPMHQLAPWDKHVMREEIKYGEVVHDGLRGLRLRAAESVPRFRGRRLEIADASRVKNPSYQALYI